MTNSINLHEYGRTPNDALRPGSAITHGIGIAFSLFAMVYLTAAVCIHQVYSALPPVLIYTFSLLFLYSASTIYHSVPCSIKGRLLLRKLDHCMIYYLIAGSYTAVCLIGLPGYPEAGILLLLVWLCAIIGTALSLLWISMPRWICAALYVSMGWLALFSIHMIYLALPRHAFILLLAGGAAYTVGGILYALKIPLRDHPFFGCHEIFHLFILLGSILHFLMIILLI